MVYLRVVVLNIAFVHLLCGGKAGAGNLTANELECVNSVGLDMNIVSTAKNSNWTVEESDGVKQYSLCIMNKAGVMSNEGVFKVDVALSKVNKEDRDATDRLIDQCLSRKNLAPMEKAWKFWKCYITKPKNSTFMET